MIVYNKQTCSVSNLVAKKGWQKEYINIHQWPMKTPSADHKILKLHTPNPSQSIPIPGSQHWNASQISAGLVLGGWCSSNQLFCLPGEMQFRICSINCQGRVFDGQCSYYIISHKHFIDVSLCIFMIFYDSLCIFMILYVSPCIPHVTLQYSSILFISFLCSLLVRCGLRRCSWIFLQLAI